ncbi:MAG: S1 RNA-binding domain-containing protein, partial [Chitinophagaceae bacterium]|nr:S1 RNA-binding domain-containing protein [Chitinophagaceae bacterium]
KVPRLGEKAFEQCAGFLRIKEGENPLDGSAVHPEAYTLVKQMAADSQVDVKHLIGNEDLVKKINPKSYISEQFGVHTIEDILKELQKPGLDPRSEVQQFEFAAIYSIEEVQVGMVLPGIVTNLTRFGAFIDIGVKQDGLVHVSEIAHKYIQDPNEVLKLNDKVTVKVLEVDQVRKRIALSIKQTQEAPPRKEFQKRSARSFESREKEPDLSNASLTDALSALKKKFGR